MNLAILGATGQIGRCLALAYAPRHDVTLFVRRPDAAEAFASDRGLEVAVAPYEAFAERRFDLVINAVGDGVPGRIRNVGAAILDVTARFDQLCLGSLERHRETGYVFLSSGALYGPEYREALLPDPVLRVPIETVEPDLFYPLAKRIAELRHRDRPALPIADVRIFGFVSPELDLASDFLVAQMLSALVRGETFETGPVDVVRDYIGPEDLVGLIDVLLANGCPNGAYDILSAAPTSKLRLLDALASRCGLDYQVETARQSPEYMALPPRLSNNRAAESLGFRPTRSSLDNVLCVAETIRASNPVSAGRPNP